MRPAYTYDGVRWAIWALLSLIVPVAAVFVWRGAWWPPLLLVAWTAGAGFWHARRLNIKYRDLNTRMLDHSRRSAIRTLSHHRHDWMNDLQILYGYIRLNKTDKAAQVVDRIRERMENDSRVSQIGNPELATFLLSFRTQCDHLRLDVRIADGVQWDKLAADPDRWASCVIGLINAYRYRSSVPGAAENVLRLSFSQDDRDLTLKLEYEGEWTAEGGMAEETRQLINGIGQWTEETSAAGDPARARQLTVTFPLTG